MTSLARFSSDNQNEFLRRERGQLIEPISVPPISNDAVTLQKKEFKELSSYNWLDKETATIMVPGEPGKWTPKPLPKRLVQDRGLIFIDQNGYRQPTFPLEPLFRSIFVVDPKFDPKQADLVSDRNNLRKLIFACSAIPIDPFRVDIELVGNTMLFTRREKQSSEILTQFRGYGHSFEKEFTSYSSGLHNSTGHHRVVQYTLGTINIILRFEVDGYVEESSSSKDTTIEDLSSRLGSMNIRAPMPATKSSQLPSGSTSSTSLKIIRGGAKMPHHAMLEIKTRAKHKPIQNSDVIYQLWFANIPRLMIGYHMRGSFTTVEEIHFARRFEMFERDSWREILKMVLVIEKIRKVMKDAKKKRAILVYEGYSLRLYERTGEKRSLPADLLSKWD